VTDEDVGLKVLYEPGEGEGDATIEYVFCRIYITEINNIYSVVAIHGIGAHPDDTWCKDVDQDESSTPRSINWLKDPKMLPSAMKDARIMRYGYHSQWFGRDALKQTTSSVAPRLLDALKRRRRVHGLLSTVTLPTRTCADESTGPLQSPFDIHIPLFWRTIGFKGLSDPPLL